MTYDARERAKRDCRDLLQRNRILARKLKLTVEQSKSRTSRLCKRIEYLEGLLRDSNIPFSGDRFEFNSETKNYIVLTVKELSKFRGLI